MRLVVIDQFYVDRYCVTELDGLLVYFQIKIWNFQLFVSSRGS